MTNTVKDKIWNMSKGLLYFESGGKLCIPSADEVYDAVFDNKFSQNIDQEDVIALKDKMSFSKYPVELVVALKTGDDSAIEILIYAIIRDSEVQVDSDNKADHIIINNRWYPFAPEALNDIFTMLESSNIDSPGKIGLGQYLFLLKNFKDFIRDGVQLKEFKLPEKYLKDKPKNIKAELYPYQIKGWQWLRFMKDEKIGGILADEMGLGKTLQIITLIGSENRKKGYPSLIVAPTTLLENWRREFEKFTPDIKTTIHRGSQRTGFPTELKNNDVVITSYDTIIRDSSLFNQVEWQIVVCDEAQAIKNSNTKRAISIKKIPRQIAFAVSGTPIENRLTDLWSIMDFTLPGYLGDRNSFENKYETSADGPAILETMISPLILRRLVADVAKDLPPKIIIPQALELSESEITLYEEIRETTEREFASNASLVVLIRLRMLCTHPFLISEIPNADPALHSNKYARFVEIMDEIVTNGSKALVFTSFNKMNDMIVSDIKRRFSIYTDSIDGRTDSTDRQKIVDEFSTFQGAAILVLNPIAAGTGLNITAANHVIHYNLEWNPAKEDQASARAYRRGQDRPVTIHRLYYIETVEEVINERLDRKRALAGTAIVGVQGEEQDYVDILTAITKSPKNHYEPE